MKKILLFFGVALLSFSAKAQQITFTATIDPVYANDASVTITAQGENKDLAVDMQTLPIINGSPTVTSPSNVNASLFGLTNITRVSYYNPVNGTKSSFTAKIGSQYGADATVKWIFNCSFVNINAVAYSNGTVPFSVTIKPGSRPLPVFYSAAYSKTFTRNNCGSGYVGSTSSFGLPYGGKTSTVSQAAANQLAIDYVNTNGQASVNSTGTCSLIYNSIAYSGNFIRNNCDSHSDPGPAIPYSQSAGAATSTVSQADADAQGLTLFNTNGQNSANANGSCTIRNKTFISYSNQAKPGSKITRLQVYNGTTLVADFNEAALLAGAEIDPGNYKFVITTVGPISSGNVGWASLEIRLLDAVANGFIVDNNGGTTYTFNNVNTTNSHTLQLFLYYLYA